MSTRTVALITWSMCALSLALTAISLLLLTLNVLEPVESNDLPGALGERKE